MNRKEFKKLPEGTIIVWNHQNYFVWMLFIKRFGRLFVLGEENNLFIGEIEYWNNMDSDEYMIAPKWVQNKFKIL